ncbi:uncharacterized protein A4U43_C09F2160 [Asparagus officinalis]|uniref:F-box domain-containing protein n=1 Tax=Asparagus officinalis TaxID=4686 RepID=A0A5P1E4P4_ASPOF|nr:F-box protein SKIP14-like [Asparagus officinalis]ONK57601.1 uncharacterized protein A4U43_C09F2160 [Asparagus officinalis]
MTLNVSSYPGFPASVCSDDDFDWTIWDIGTENCGKPCLLNRGKSDYYENVEGRDWVDPIDLLPADPFGMGLGSNLAAAIVGWFEDLGANSSDRKFYCWNGDSRNASGGWFDDGFFGVSGGQNGTFEFVVGAEETSTATVPAEESYPHEGLVLSLGYLGVQDLLSVEKVCRSLRSAVQSDPLLWRCIHIVSPLSARITDDTLLRLTRRAHGSLQCLSLVGCSRITDDGLKKVLESNPRLQKLSVSGCLRLSLDGVISNLKAFKSSGLTGIKHLKLGRLFTVSPEQYEELWISLGCGDETGKPKLSNPRFYHCSVSSIACDDDRALDIELCPGCQNYKLVFDCPSESCQAKGPESCRACFVCIGRCAQCGRCVNDCSFVENFFLEYICSGCWKQASPSSHE